MTNADRIDPLAVLTERLAAVIRARAGAAGDEVALALRSLFAALQEGHTCVPLAEVAAAAPVDSPLATPATLRAALLRGGATSAPDSDPAMALPLALDHRDRLYLHRHRAAERRLAAALRARLLEPPTVPAATLAALQVGRSQTGAIDWQDVAIAAAVRSRLAVITGGPGTGKTTTVRRLVRVLLAGEPDLQIALVAPTGKAAARLGDALHGEFGADRVPRATTLHRLLGYLALEDLFRRTAESPLPHDLVVVDEASMVDLELMDALLQALKPTARLLLLGDRDQLSSVAAGQVLGDLCRGNPPDAPVGAALAATCREHLGVALPTDAAAAPFADCIVALRENHRFAEHSGIGAFATALAARRADVAMAALQAGHDDLVLLPPRDHAALLTPFLPALLAQLQADSPAAALRAQGELRLLCAVRHGPFGKEALDAAVEVLLREHGHPTDALFYRGRPLLITANDHQSGLHNGDLGVIWPDADGRLQAWFPRPGDAEPRAFLPLRLPPHETAWAMTVHKSQGSEFQDVVVVLPDRPGPLLHAPLIYTAVTRARRRATVVADAELLRTALQSQPDRSSGLLDLLRAPLAGPSR